MRKESSRSRLIIANGGRGGRSRAGVASTFDAGRCGQPGLAGAVGEVAVQGKQARGASANLQRPQSQLPTLLRCRLSVEQKASCRRPRPSRQARPYPSPLRILCTRMSPLPLSCSHPVHEAGANSVSRTTTGVPNPIASHQGMRPTERTTEDSLIEGPLGRIGFSGPS